MSDPYTSNDGEDVGTLTGTTGKNDSSSVWGGIISGVGSLGNTAGGIYRALNPPKAKTNTSNFLPFIIGGGLLLLVLVFVAMGRK